MDRCLDVVLPLSKLQPRNNVNITDGDLENPNNRAEQNYKLPTPKIQIISKSLQAFTSIYRKIQNKPFDLIDYSEKEVYRRLMKDLENGKEKFTVKWGILVSIEIIVFLAHLVCLIVSLTVPAIDPEKKRIFRLRIWQWIALSFSLFSSLSVIRLLTYLVSIPVLWWWKIDRYIVFFITQIKQCVDVTLWFGSVLFVWYVWFRPRLKHSHGDLSVVVVHHITRLLIALDLGAFLWFLKNILYLKLEADLHYTQLFDRIRLTVVYFHGLKMIDSHGVWKFLIKNKEDHKRKREDKREGKEELPPPAVAAGGGDEKVKRESKNLEANKLASKNIWKDVYEIKRETVPIWILRRLSEEYLFHIQQKKALLKMKIDSMLDDEELKEKAEEMLNLIIVERETRSDIKHEDLVKYNMTPEEEAFLFQLFKESSKKGESRLGKVQDLDDNNQISRNDFLNWAVRAFKNCAGLESTLRSSKIVFVKLNRLLSAFVLTVVLLIWLLLSSIVDTGQLAVLFSPFVAATFVFGDSCRKMFEGIIFAFAMHPFDVGDRVIIDDEQMKVNELHILTSVFYKYESQELVIYPNSDLASKKIINLDITPDQGDQLEFAAPEAPPEDIQDLQVCIKLYMDENTSYTSDNKVVKTAIGDGEIKMAVHFKYLVSYLSSETKAVRKSEILTQIMQFLEEIKRQNKKNSWATNPLILEFAVSFKGTKLEHITIIKREILRYVAKYLRPYKDCSKVVMIELNREKDYIKMALYLRRRSKMNASGTLDKDVVVDDDDDGDDADDDEDESKEMENIVKCSSKSKEKIEIEVKELADSIINGRSPSPWDKTRASMLRDNLGQSSTFRAMVQSQSIRESDVIIKGG